jgi:hypothetical protein
MEKYNINKNLVSRKLDNELIILNTNNSAYYGLEDTGIEIFNFISKNKDLSFNDILSFVTRNYKTDDINIKKDVKEFLNDMVKEKIVVINKV